MDKSRFYRSIPKVDILLEDDRIQEAIARFDRDGCREGADGVCAGADPYT